MTSPTATSRVIQRGGIDLFTVATQNDGSVLVTAVNAAATAFGTETVTNIEMINFFIRVRPMAASSASRPDRGPEPHLLGRLRTTSSWVGGQ